VASLRWLVVKLELAEGEMGVNAWRGDLYRLAPALPCLLYLGAEGLALNHCKATVLKPSQELPIIPCYEKLC
jgi:hypothetical protein